MNMISLFLGLGVTGFFRAGLIVAGFRVAAGARPLLEGATTAFLDLLFSGGDLCSSRPLEVSMKKASDSLRNSSVIFFII